MKNFRFVFVVLLGALLCFPWSVGAAPLKAPAWKIPASPALSEQDATYLDKELRQRRITDSDIPRLEKLADEGSMLAAYRLGMFQLGEASSKQKNALEKAAEYFRLAAKNGSTAACFELTEIYVRFQRDNALPFWDAKSAYIWTAIGIAGPVADNINGLANEFEKDMAADKLDLLDKAMLPSEKKQIEKILKAWPKSMPPLFPTRTEVVPGAITPELLENAKAAKKSKDPKELCKWYGIFILRGDSEMEHHARKILAKVVNNMSEAERNAAFAEAEKWHNSHPVASGK